MGKTRKDQRTLWDLRCVECDKLLERTPSGYLACPRGHGALRHEEAFEGEYDGECDDLSLFPDEEASQDDPGRVRIA